MSIDKDELASFLVILNSVYQHTDTNNLNSAIRGERCRQLHRFGILSLSAIASVVGCSPWQVEQAIVGMPKPKARGKLNPKHLTMLSYMLSRGKVNPLWLRIMLEEGTNLSTISDLAGIPESTLQRHRRNLE